MAMGGLARPIVGLLAILQLGTAITIICITGLHMAGVDLHNISSLWNQKQCLLTDGGNIAMCYYVYALGAVSIVFTLAIGLMQICTCNACGCGAVMDSVFAAMAGAWWVVGGFIILPHTVRANAAGLPQREWRDATTWLIWIAAMEFGAMFAVHLVRALSKLCKCCGGRGGGDAEKGGARQRPVSAALELGKEVRGRAYLVGNKASLQRQFGDANI